MHFFGAIPGASILFGQINISGYVNSCYLKHVCTKTNKKKIKIQKVEAFLKYHHRKKCDRKCRLLLEDSRKTIVTLQIIVTAFLYMYRNDNENLALYGSKL